MDNTDFLHPAFHRVRLGAPLSEKRFSPQVFFDQSMIETALMTTPAKNKSRCAQAHPMNIIAAEAVSATNQY
jgi:hypothetical protein